MSELERLHLARLGDYHYLLVSKLNPTIEKTMRTYFLYIFLLIKYIEGKVTKEFLIYILQ